MAAPGGVSSGPKLRQVASAESRNLVRRPGPAGTETAVKVDRIRPCGCRPFRAWKPRTGTCAAARSPGLGPILSRFCRDQSLSRDNSPNSGSHGPLRDHTHHITNVEGPAGEIPAHPATNWLTFNNFRSASTSGSATDAVPVIVDVCDNECVDNLKLTLQVGNAGTAELPAGVNTSIYGLQLDDSWNLIVTMTTDAAVEPGATSTGFVVDLDPLDFLGGKLRVVVDDDNGVDLFDECHEDNNTIEIGEGLCLVRIPG